MGTTQAAIAASPTLDDTAVQAFAKSLRGELICPSDDAYDAARRVWNGNIDRRPALVARCAGVADVIAAVNFAREHRLTVAVRGGAHSAAGHGTCDGGLVIDLTPMRGIQVDPTARVARAQPGVTWAELDHETQAFGLATTGGTVSNTGIAGLTLGGGLGWLQGLHGLTCDNLIAADVVTADGRFITANEQTNADLLWGLRGGGGNFGIVTSFEYRLHPVGPMVVGGMALHPINRAKDVLAFYREFVPTLPDAAEAFVVMLTTPDGAPMLGLLLGYNGPVEDGLRVLAPAREFGPPVADLVGPMPYSVRQSLIDEGVASHGLQRYWKSGFATRLSDEFIDTIASGAANFSSPLSAVLIVAIHGAATRVASDQTAFALRQPQWDVNVVSQWTDPAESDRHIAWTRQLWSRLEPHLEASAYINHIAGDDRPEKVRASFGQNYDRLVALKNKYDPTNLFHLNPNVRPTA